MTDQDIEKENVEAASVTEESEAVLQSDTSTEEPESLITEAMPEPKPEVAEVKYAAMEDDGEDLVQEETEKVGDDIPKMPNRQLPPSVSPNINITKSPLEYDAQYRNSEASELTMIIPSVETFKDTALS